MSTTTDPENDTSWNVIGKHFQQGSNVQTEYDWLTVPQLDLCVNFSEFNKPLGRPIDANIAVTYIANFANNFSLVYSPDNHENFDAFVDGLSKEELIAFFKRRDKLASKVITELNYAMSIDRNMVLKLLSQPKCEGLRFYLCARPHDDTVPNVDTNPEDFEISLVVVGIDCEGYDLKYYSKDTVTYNDNPETPGIVPHQLGTPSIKDVQMQSMAGEYVTPPFGIDLITRNNFPSYDEHFVLFNIATGQYVPPPTPTPPPSSAASAK